MKNIRLRRRRIAHAELAGKTLRVQCSNAKGDKRSATNDNRQRERMDHQCHRRAGAQADDG
jgi:hypothetical protein